MSIVGTVSAPRPDFAHGSSLGTRLALEMLAASSDRAEAAAPASPASPAQTIPLETGVDFTTLFAVRYAAALRAVSRRQPKDQRSRKEGSSW